MTQARLSLGKQGEDLACRELRRRGYAVLARRYRTRWGEIDIVARDGDTLVFVEVKTRRSTGFGGPVAAVNVMKQSRLIDMARGYLVGLPGPEPPCSFDVVGVTLPEGERPVLEVLVNAFGVR